MSYRELKQFTHIIRALGYEQPIGIDSFDTPNFGLMAELLKWLSKLYHPEIFFTGDISTEQGRVDFVKSIVQQLAKTSAIRINPRHLYASDRFAVRELLKLAAPMYQGLSTTDAIGITKSKPGQSPTTDKILKMSEKIPKIALELYDELETELSIRDTRNQIISTMPPLDQLEKDVSAAVDSAAARLDVLTRELDKLNSDSEALKSKIAQRKHELERQSKRLLSVQTIRPAFMDDYEELEQDLSVLFKEYSQQYRNVDYYESELQKISDAQIESQKEIERTFEEMKKKASTIIVNNMTNPKQFGLDDGFLKAAMDNDDILNDPNEIDDQF